MHQASFFVWLVTMDAHLFMKSSSLIVLSALFSFYRFHKVLKTKFFKGYLYFASCAKFVIKGNNGGNTRTKKISNINA